MRILKRPLSSYNIVFYKIIVALRCSARCAKWIFGKEKFAKKLTDKKLPYRAYKHQSVLVRTLGDVNMQLQYNKITNIKLATEKMSGLIINPGESFSFCYLSGRPTKRKGYLDGMLLADGEAKQGIGGGICQVANLIHWLCLHSPLTVTERHHHGFDPFPDSGRVVPFGSGASIFYNYVDYQFRNDTDYIFQLSFWQDKKYLNGDLRADTELPHKFHVQEREHEFLCCNGVYYRKNELWRSKIDKSTGNSLELRCIQRNFSLVKYIPAEFREIGEEELEEFKKWSVEAEADVLYTCFDD